MIIILVSITSLSILGSKIYRDSFEEQANQNMLQMIDQVETNVQAYIDNVEDIMYYLRNDPVITDFLQLQENERPDAEMKQTLKRNLSVYTDNASEIAGILVVNQYSQFVSNEMRRIKRDPLTVESWYQAAVETPQETLMISNPIGRNIATDKNYSVDDVLSMVKAVQDPISGDVLGVILIDVKLEGIKHMLEKATLGQNGLIYIVDKSGDIVYTPVNPVVYRIRPEWVQDTAANNLIKEINGEPYRILYNAANTHDEWKIIGVLSLQDSLQTVTDIQYYTLLITVITLIFAIIAASFFTGSITKPLKKLSALMKKIEGGDLNHRFKSRYNDEIGQLGNSFNRMVGEIQQLINLVYIEQKKKREAELQVLQAQIKPHFLYNTLDTIQWMAQEYNAQDIVEMIAALTNLFRIGLNKGNERITVSQELKHVESYMIIQMARYEEKLDFKIDAEDAVLKYHVLKVILQPLVENAIYHGLKARRGKGRINIKVRKSEEAIVFYVADDGVGMKPEFLAEINDRLAQGGKNGHDGYGLFNVNERIKLTYGPQYGIRVESVYGKGTTVILSHPLVEG